MQELALRIFDKYLFASREGVGATFGPAFHEQRLLYLTVSYIHCVQYLENLRKIFGKNVTSASCFNMVVIDECKLLFCHIRSYFYLISLPWKYASRGITWSRLSFRHCQTSYNFKHQRYCFFWVFRNYTDQKFHNFYHVCYNFWTIHGGFSFSLTA